MTKKFFSSLILFFSIIIFIYVIYKSEIYWNGELRNYYITYYFLSFFLILFSIFTFFINDELKTSLIISLITILIFVFSYEGYLTLEKSIIMKKKKAIYETNTGKKYDTRSPDKVFYNLKQKDDNITLSTKPISFVYKDDLDLIPLSGKSLTKTIGCNENGYYSIYESDRYGFNNPDSEWDSTEIEFLLVGDSYVHGSCVNRPNDISSQLRILSKKSVLNLGMKGNGPLLEYASLIEYYKPNTKAILWLFFEGNDLADLSDEIDNKILNKYFNKENFTQNLKLKQKYLNEINSNFFPKNKTLNFFDSDFFSFLKLTKLRYKIRIYLINNKNKDLPKKFSDEKIEDIFKKILHKTKTLSDNNNTKLYFIYLPEYPRYYDKNYKLEKYNLVKNIVNEMNIPFIDIHENIFMKEDMPLNLFPFGMNGHYTVEGYKKISKNIYKIITGTKN
tara:strand:- start:437 stop:1777 length:1341 start_codon:yes stop_codon:yes gene_type:complete